MLVYRIINLLLLKLLLKNVFFEKGEKEERDKGLHLIKRYYGSSIENSLHCAADKTHAE